MAVSVVCALVVAIGLDMMPVPAARAEPLVALDGIDDVGEGGVVHLQGGGRLCLAGLWVPAASSAAKGAAAKGAAAKGAVDWRAGWRRVLARSQVRRQASRDRYGCARVSVETADGAPLEPALIEAGLAAVEPVSAVESGPALATLLGLEDKARRAGRGVWGDPGARPRAASDDLGGLIGTRQIVEGRVRRVSENDRYLYINFGADWRTDFTVRLRRKLAEAAGLDRSRLDGERLRVRGVLQESRGPLIDISHPQQIEFLP